MPASQDYPPDDEQEQRRENPADIIQQQVFHPLAHLMEPENLVVDCAIEQLEAAPTEQDSTPEWAAAHDTADAPAL